MNERKRILDMVEKGTLSAKEALLLLEALEEAETVREQKESDIINEISREVDRKGRDSRSSYDRDKYSQQFNGAKDKLMDFMNTALQKIKDFEFDFQFGQSAEVSHVFEEKNAVISYVDIDVANGKVDIQSWDQDDLRIECEAKVYRTEDEEEAKTTFLKNTLFSVENGKLRYSTQLKWMKVDTTIFVPKAEYEKLNVRIFNGAFSSKGLNAKDFTAKSANGKINLTGLHTENLEVETANGHITIEESKSAKLEAETINGALKVNGEYQKLDLQSFNGNVVCKLSNQDADSISVKTVTGNVDIYVPDELAMEGELKTNLGSFKLELEGMNVLEEKSEMAQKQLRFQRKGLTESPLHILADAKTGSIFIKKVDSTNLNPKQA
ncbi:DUF4097 family beta strand repeat-containing protein [Falsibacillus pallidus]|uniref:DUF4097 and DUF4098 domain-containing protein YvlB n=1 Tax=Falsibacillus pallidus TaxID=493781 RepID=A0A370GB97_9BACI|nr:DUF4097 domain-containing protein [Falsibacillus pallidus]RDI41038.1 DUF4097 and DUF4098 domain-containing protein YvlB [Falsibacillus pallidus]